MLAVYYRLRGYNPRGIPTAKTVKRLGITAKKAAVSNKRLAHYRLADPGTNPFKRVYLSVLLWFVGRAIAATARVDGTVKGIFESFPDEFVFVLKVAPDGPAMVVGKNQRGKVKYFGSDGGGRNIDLTMIIKNIEAAILLFTFQEATVTAVARNRLIVDGDLPSACAVVRILDTVEVYLLPRVLASLAVRRYPQWPFHKKVIGRTMIYLRALLGI